MLVTTQTPIVRRFEPSDVMAILNRDGSQVPPQTILEQAVAGPAWTATLDAVPLGCGGIVLPWPGIGMAWMVLSAEMLEHRVWLTRTVRAFLEEMTVRYALHRVEAVAVETADRNQAWLECLGFTRERDGVAQAYLTDRQSVIRYERVIGG